MKLLRSAAFTGALLLGGSAYAADLSVKAPPPMMPPPPPAWTGFYLGFNGGWGWSTFDTDPLGLGVGFAGANNSLNGAVFGGQVGYNWQFAPNWVFGVEGDFDGTGINGTVSGVFPNAVAPFTNGFMASSRINWLATARGRLGYTWGPGMFYVTGGGAWANVTHDFMVSNGFVGTSVAGSFDTDRSGFVVGAGLEWLVAQNWTVRAEYLFYDLTNNNNNGFGFAGCFGCGVNGVDHNINVFRLGANYKF